MERPALEKELQAAEFRLADELSPRNLFRLNTVKTQTAATREVEPVALSSAELTRRYHEEP
jgi:hypothetical protein